MIESTPRPNPARQPARRGEDDAPGEPSSGEPGETHPRARVTRVRQARVAPPPAFTPARVRAVRAGLGLPQPAFAAALAVSVGTVAAWEQGRRAPVGPARRLLQLAEAHPEVLLAAIGRGDPR